MQDILNLLTADNVILAAASGLGAAIALGLKAIFAFAGKITTRTSTGIDDKIISGAKESLKEKIRDL